LPIAASTVTDAAVSAGPLLWAGLIAFLAVMVVVDLRVGAAGQEMTTRRAATWSAIWLGLALAFGAGLWILAGGEAGETYLAGYAMEKALSLDNVFVFTLIFAGAAALEQFSWVAWPFAALLVFTGYKILKPGGHDDEGAKIVERVRRRVPAASPALLALLAIAFADVLFAVDSVPAILAITTDTFVVFAANAFALMGLRALFFLVAGLVQRFAYLQTGLGILLIAIAGKLAYGELTGEKIPTVVTLVSIAAVLIVSILASLLKERRTGFRPQPQEG